LAVTVSCPRPHIHAALDVLPTPVVVYESGHAVQLAVS
jgi:hypothetical protein